MVEWSSLLLLVPVALLPLVLLLSFAGCDKVFSLDPPGPLIVSVTGTSASNIAVVWSYSFDPDSRFQVERTKAGEAASPLLDATGLTFEDVDLEEGTTYSYRVRAVFSDGETSNFSAPVSGKTLSFQPTFSASLIEDEPDWAGFCLVQRIEPLRLFRSGPEVRITVRASSAADLTIDRIFISRPATGGDPYDSAGDLTLVASAVMVPANTAATLPLVAYDLDRTQPLLIAFDFSATPNSGNVRRLPAVPSSDASAFFNAGSEAGVGDRQTGYTPLDAIYLVEKIEVAAP